MLSCPEYRTHIRGKSWDLKYPAKSEGEWLCCQFISLKSPFILYPGFLSTNDLLNVLEALTSVSTHWYNLGLALNVGTDKLDEIKANNAESVDCLREMLNHRLKRVEPLSWPLVVKALRRDCVCRNIDERLIKKIEEKYI